MSKPSADERKTAILDAVVQVIIDIGFSAMTVGDVAKRAGVSTALVHYHFSSKAELILAALTAASEEDVERREDSADGNGTALDRIDRVLCGSLAAGSDDASWLLWIEAWGQTKRTPEIRKVMAELDRHETEVLLRLIAEGEASGEFVCNDPTGAAERLSALRDGLAIQQTLFETDHAVDLLRSAIRNNLELVPDASTATQQVVSSAGTSRSTR